MATLGGHRGNFTWALNKYNSTDNPSEREKYARHLAQYLNAAQADGFTADEVTQGQSYPADEINKFINAPPSPDIIEMSEEVVKVQLEEKVNFANVARMGAGNETVYAYGYKCTPDRLKIGMTVSNCIQRIVQQINESTPDQPILHVEIKTNHCRSLERAMHGVLESRGKKLFGGGQEWFNTTAAEITDIYKFVTKSGAGG